MTEFNFVFELSMQTQPFLYVVLHLYTSDMQHGFRAELATVKQFTLYGVQYG